jgi:hypothetical protein
MEIEYINSSLNVLNELDFLFTYTTNYKEMLLFIDNKTFYFV